MYGTIMWYTGISIVKGDSVSGKSNINKWIIFNYQGTLVKAEESVWIIWKNIMIGKDHYNPISQFLKRCYDGILFQ